LTSHRTCANKKGTKGREGISREASMAKEGTPLRTTVIPTMRYRNARRAVDDLCAVFGFERHAVYEGDDGAIVHAELSLGNGMIMLGTVRDTPFGQFMQQPDETGGRETQSPYLVVADADAVYARAKAAGFDIVLDIKDEDYGGRGFSCRDREGHLWNVGTYDPWIPAA
jgi:uncharacterized glyoxalase superfamily protein PhnB